MNTFTDKILESSTFSTIFNKINSITSTIEDEDDNETLNEMTNNSIFKHQIKKMDNASNDSEIDVDQPNDYKRYKSAKAI